MVLAWRERDVPRDDMVFCVQGNSASTAPVAEELNKKRSLDSLETDQQAKIVSLPSLHPPPFVSETLYWTLVIRPAWCSRSMKSKRRKTRK